MADIQAILKAITSSDLSNGGTMSAQQGNRFLDYVVDSSDLIKKCTFVRMQSTTYELDYISIGTRIMRKGVEATAPTDLAGVTHDKRTLTTTEIILPFDISFNYLEDNIEGDNIQDSLMRLFATQWGNDLEDLAINGDSSDTTSPDKAFVSIEDGWLKLAKDNKHTGVHKVDIATGYDSYLDHVFPQMVAAMPEKWKRNVKALSLMCSPADQEAYRLELSARATALGDTFLATGADPTFLGYPVVSIPTLTKGTFLFGNPKNLAMGVFARNMRVGKQIQERKRLIEVTITSRVDFEIIADDQLVVGYDATP